MEIHAYANLFPMCTEAEIHELAADIAKNGLRQPIVIDEDEKILDGRNRAAACKIAGVAPTYEPFVGSDEEKLSYVVSVNLHRRHLKTSQRAMVAAKLLPLYEEQAAERQKQAGGDKKSSKKSVPANLPEPIKGDARDKAGAALNVSGKAVDMAASVQAKAIPEIADAVASGQLAVSAAVLVADMPVDKQREIVASGGTDAVKSVASKTRRVKSVKGETKSLTVQQVKRELPTEVHRALGRIPKMNDELLSHLVEDMRQYGQRLPIIVDQDNHILDGRSRLTACQQLGLQPVIELFHGDEQQRLAYVLSLNLCRGQLTRSQCAMLRADLGVT